MTRNRLTHLLSVALLTVMSAIGYPALAESYPPTDGEIRGFVLLKQRGEVPDQPFMTGEAKELRLEDFKGKVVLLNFWATWCGPCRQELPELNQLHDKLSGQGLVIMGMNIDNKTQDVFSFLKDVPVNFPVLLDPKQKISQSYSVSGMPNTFILDRDGKVRHIHKGYQPGVIDQYEKEIRTLLNEL